jgi:protein-S-isoprenylcysteine O-methyltransferase Ste14
MGRDRRTLIFNGFGILASLFILLSGEIIPSTGVDILVQVFGLLLIIWSLITIRVSKQSNNLPKGYFFLNKGPYEILRHPIYAGYLLIMISMVEVEFSFLRFIALLILCICIMFKIIREEYLMKQEVKEYRDYKIKTKALIPYLL